jgi:hypothetical protein
MKPTRAGQLYIFLSKDVKRKIPDFPLVPTGYGPHSLLDKILSVS